MAIVVHRLTRSSLDSTHNITWHVKIGSDNKPEDPKCVRIRVWGWNYRPPATLAEGSAPNSNLDVTIDTTTIATGLGDGTEKLLLDQVVTWYMRAGDHTITFSLSSGGPVDIEAELIVEE